MKINIICVGKLKEDFSKSAAAEYEKRLGRFCDVNIINIPDKSIPENPSQAQIEAVIAQEGEQILKKIAKGDYVVAMCIEGKELSSEAFAQKLADIQMQSSVISFVIGGSLGLCDKVKKLANFKLSLSHMTMPHNIARIVLEEQIYRGFKIMANETYHK